MKQKMLFVCHGNICRSPMAEFMMKKLVKEAGREADFEIDSVAFINLSNSLLARHTLHLEGVGKHIDQHQSTPS